MDTVIWLHSWIRVAREDPKPFFFHPPLFYLLPGPLSLFTILFRDASDLTPEVRGHWSTGAIPLLLPTALSLWFTTHTGPCHSGPTQPSLTLTYMRTCRASLSGRRILSALSGSSSWSLVYLEITALEMKPLTVSFIFWTNNDPVPEMCFYRLCVWDNDAHEL